MKRQRYLHSRAVPATACALILSGSGWLIYDFGWDAALVLASVSVAGLLIGWLIAQSLPPRELRHEHDCYVFGELDPPRPLAVPDKARELRDIRLLERWYEMEAK